eukprot:1376268-Amorphochlora_amoeboformis.AAC.1
MPHPHFPGNFWWASCSYIQKVRGRKGERERGKEGVREGEEERGEMRERGGGRERREMRGRESQDV